MSIRSSNELPINKCVEIKRDYRCGFLTEDECALHIRRFSLDSVMKYDYTDPDTQAVTPMRSVTFTESEIEYEYWYVMHGKGFRNPAGLTEYTANKNFEYDCNDTYENIMRFCIDQSSMSDLPFFADRVADAFNYTTVCDTFPQEQP